MVALHESLVTWVFIFPANITVAYYVTHLRDRTDVSFFLRLILRVCANWFKSYSRFLKFVRWR